MIFLENKKQYPASLYLYLEHEIRKKTHFTKTTPVYNALKLMK